MNRRTVPAGCQAYADWLTAFVGNTIYKRAVIVQRRRHAEPTAWELASPQASLHARTTESMSSPLHRTHPTLRWLCAFLVVLVTMTPSTTTAATPSTRLIISAVLPNPSSGPEWVAIENRVFAPDKMPHKVFLPWVARPSSSLPIGEVGQPPALTIVDVAGWQLGYPGMWYTLPHDLPPIPAGARVIVYFDGLSAVENDYDYGDGVAELHTPAGMVNVFPDTKGKVFLYAGDVNTPVNLRAQYEWDVNILD
jgi:hypothetical protein